jgi:uncharacterized membrane protein (DUF4010 family)
LDDLDLFYRFSVAIAIGVIVGAERHWQEREEPEGSRTAGIRTFSLIGMLGGGAGLLEQAVADLGGSAGFVTLGLFIAFAITFGKFRLRELEAEKSFGATTLVAALVTFVLGDLAVIGDMRLAAAGGVIMTAILASRGILHRFMKALTWPELRSAIVLLGMTLVVLPLLPHEPIGPFGGISPARTWTLAVLLAGISFLGYVAVKLLGTSRGELLAGAIGGLVSSTAVTVSNARKAAGGGEAKPLAGGALAAGAVSYLRTAALTSAIAPPLALEASAPLIAGALVTIVPAFLLLRHAASSEETPSSKNPFDLLSVAKLTLLLVVVAFLAKAASAIFGTSGLLVVSFLSGLADVDAVTVTVSGLLKQGLALDIAFFAIAAGVTANTIGKMAYAAVLGRARFAFWYGITSVFAIATAAAVYLVMASLSVTG